MICVAGLRKLVGTELLGVEKLMKLLAESRDELQEAVAQLLVAVCHGCEENVQFVRQQLVQARFLASMCTFWIALLGILS